MERGTLIRFVMQIHPHPTAQNANGECLSSCGPRDCTLERDPIDLIVEDTTQISIQFRRAPELCLQPNHQFKELLRLRMNRRL